MRSVLLYVLLLGSALAGLSRTGAESRGTGPTFGHDLEALLQHTTTVLRGVKIQGLAHCGQCSGCSAVPVSRAACKQHVQGNLVPAQLHMIKKLYC